MQSFGEQRGHGLDTSLPSVRLIQDIIRTSRPVCIQMGDGLELQGMIRWQDPQFIALQTAGQDGVTLLSRRAITLLRSVE